MRGCIIRYFPCLVLLQGREQGEVHGLEDGVGGGQGQGALDSEWSSYGPRTTVY
jgi:hypothetical protein